MLSAPFVGKVYHRFLQTGICNNGIAHAVSCGLATSDHQQSQAIAGTISRSFHPGKHRATCICSEGGSPNNKHAPGEESAHICKILEMGRLSVKQ